MGRVCLCDAISSWEVFVVVGVAAVVGVIVVVVVVGGCKRVCGRRASERPEQSQES
jgi:hypothetical protein